MGWNIIATSLTAGLLVAPAAADPVEQLEAAAERLVSQHRESVALSSLGESRRGRPIWLITLGGDGADDRPAVLIVAGLDGRHQAGPAIATGIAASLLEDHADLFEGATVYIAPAINPDALVRWSAPAGLDPRFGGSMLPDDADDDRRTDEDGPVDLDGDGIISMMRIANPPPGLGLRAEFVVDEDDPRLVRKPGEDEIATHAMIIESRDADGDGQMAEDAAGGVDLDRNFPYRWEEFAEGVGEYPFSEPETRALGDWMLERPNLIAVVVIGPGDTVLNIPQAGRNDESGRIPLGIDNDDKALFELLKKKFTEATKMKSAPAVENERGSLQRWAYAHLGLVSVSTPAWVRPDQIEAEKKDEGEKPEAAEAPAEPADPRQAEYDELIGRGVPDRIARYLTGDDATRAGMRSEVESMSEAEQREMMQQVMALPEDVRARVMAIAQGQPDPGRPAGAAAASSSGETPRPAARTGGRAKASDKDKKDEEAKWLDYADERGEGFIDWTPFEHPQLGPVEIGGFVPGFKLNPPASEIDRVADEQASFIASLLGMAPAIIVEPARVEKQSDRTWRITLRLKNNADLPTRTAMGITARRLPPIRVEIDLDESRVLAGNRRASTNRLEARGGSFEESWTVLGGAGDRIGIDVRSAVFGNQRITVELGEDNR